MNAKLFPYLPSVYFAVTRLIEFFSTFFKFGIVWTIVWLLVLLKTFFIITTLYGLPFHELVKMPFMDALTQYFHHPSKFGFFYALTVPIGFFFVYSLMYYQLLRIAQAIYGAEPFSIKKIVLSNPKILFRFMIARLLFFIKFVGGFLIFIIFGVLVLVHNYFSGFALLDGTTTSIGEDVEITAQITMGIRWQIFFVVLADLTVITVGGFLPLIFFVLPTMALIDIYLYNSLKVLQQSPKDISKPQEESIAQA